MAYLAEAECQRHSWDFPEAFQYQYVITPKADKAPTGWSSKLCQGWRVSACKKLPICQLAFSDGKACGVIVGYAISPEGEMLEGKHKLPVSSRSGDALDKLERFVADLAGRFVVLVSFGKSERVYPDPVAGFGPVWNPDTRRVGASLTLVLGRPVQENPALPKGLVQPGRANYMFGHTPDANTRRIRTNHYLDLTDFSMRRFWPRDDDALDLEGRKPRDAAKEITERLGRNIAALSQRHVTALPITGGTDSRILLAAGHQSLHQITNYFVYQTNWATTFDADIATEIAQMLCVPLQVIAQSSPRYQDALSTFALRQLRKKRFVRGGLEPDTSELGSVRAMTLVPEDRLILRGNVAEMTRALRWNRAVFEDPHNTAYALQKMRIVEGEHPLFKQWEGAFLDWKADLPAHGIPRIYDLAHVELWMPSTNSAGYMRELNHVFINPFADRRLIQLTMQIPPRYRSRRRLVRDIVDLGAPELAGIDYKINRRARMQQETAA